MTSCQIVASTGIPSILFLIKKYGSKVDSFFSTGFDILKKVLFKCDESKKNLIATFIPLLIELMNMHAEELKPVKLKTGCTFLKHLAVFHDDHGEELFVNKIAATFNDMVKMLILLLLLLTVLVLKPAQFCLHCPFFLLPSPYV